MVGKCVITFISPREELSGEALTYVLNYYLGEEVAQGG